MVTVQLPVYNELYVVERLVRRVAELDYPRDRLEVQVLDDSTDETTAIIRKCVKELSGQGTNIRLLHRSSRDGYKAGALRDGLEQAKGEFIAVFDADFLPAPDFLKRCLPYFSDAKVGMVQSRWGHVNESYSLLTRALAIGIDGHFKIEQGARCSAGLFLNFNGTAGIWRRSAIESSGGWQADTLAEDLDLSYRAQLAGWRLVFLDDVVSPGEVPVQINAFKRQQFRWAKGSIQCARKLLPGVARADLPLFRKFQAMLHLTYYAVHPMMVLLLLITLPLFFLGSSNLIYFDLFALGTFGPIFMYALSQRELYPDWKGRLKYLPMLTIFGTGISLTNTHAFFEGLFTSGGTFQRTPKFGVESSSDSWSGKRYRLSFPFSTLGEVLLGIYATVTLFFAFSRGNYLLVPFLALYAIGYFYVSGLTIIHSPPRLNVSKEKLYLLLILALAAGLRLYRASMGDLSEDPYNHWLISDYLASGIGPLFSDPFGPVGLWPPLYHLFASAIILAFGQNILWLKLANVLFSLGSIFLVYLLAAHYSKSAGLLAALFLALNPLELLVSSAAYSEPMAVFFFLLSIFLLQAKRDASAGLALLLASATRYEVLLALPFLFFARRRLALILPSIFFIMAWSAYTISYQGFFPSTILHRGTEVLSFELSSGAVHESAAARGLSLASYFFLSSPLVYAAGLFFSIRNLRKSWLFPFVLSFLSLVFLATASGLLVGSFRYFSLVLPLLCIFAAAQLSGTKLRYLVIVSLILALPFYLSLYSGLDSLYSPIVRAGVFVSNSDAQGLLSNSPMPLYYSGLPAGRLFGTSVLAGLDSSQAVSLLQQKGIDYVIYVSSPPGDLDRIFPGISNGNASGLSLVYDPNDWEGRYGAKKAYVYRLALSEGRFKTTGSYISSSPMFADIDGDGHAEIIAASDMLYVWQSNGSSLPGFPAKTTGLIASTPSVAYSDQGAMIFVGSDDDRLYGWWHDGSVLPGFPKSTNGDVFSRPLILGNKVFVGSDDGKVYAWYLNGSVVEGWPVATGGFVSSSPVSFDLERDGSPEILAGSWDGGLYAWHLNGSLVPGFPLRTGAAIWATPSISDVNGDGSPDILAASDRVYSWDLNGTPLPGFPFRTNSYIRASPVIRDIDSDGTPELIVASDSLYVFNSTGSLKKGWPVYTGFYFWASPFVYDLDYDSLLEIIIGDLGGNIYAFKPDGSLLSGFPKHTGGKVFASSYAGDLYNDGRAEVLAGSWDKGVYLFSVNSSSSYPGIFPKPPNPGTGIPFLNALSSSPDNSASFVSANLSGRIDSATLFYFSDDLTWHPSPMFLSEGLYTGIVAPQRQGTVRYYLSILSDNSTYRFPKEGFYVFKD